MKRETLKLYVGQIIEITLTEENKLFCTHEGKNNWLTFRDKNHPIVGLVDHLSIKIEHVSGVSNGVLKRLEKRPSTLFGVLLLEVYQEENSIHTKIVGSRNLYYKETKDNLLTEKLRKKVEKLGETIRCWNVKIQQNESDILQKRQENREQFAKLTTSEEKSALQQLIEVEYNKYCQMFSYVKQKISRLRKSIYILRVFLRNLYKTLYTGKIVKIGYQEKQSKRNLNYV